MLQLTSELSKASLSNKRVIVRADLNVPRDSTGKIINDFKIKALLPTIDLIKQKGGKIILLTHCGRPTKNTPELSTEIFVDWFKKKGYKATFSPTINAALHASSEKNNALIILENVRFFPGEQNQDKKLAAEFAQLGDYYVNDAFGVSHRLDTSVTLLAQLFDKKNRTIGLLVEKELHLLNHLIEHSKYPFVILQGGIKGKTKLPLLKNFLDKVDAILISTPFCFTLLAAQNKTVGKSFIEKELIPDAKEFISLARESNTHLIFPVDYQVTTETFEKPYHLKESKSIPENTLGVSIGPETAKLFSSYLRKARTVFINGIPGNSAFPETLEGSRIMLSTLQNTNAFCLFAGGDTVALVQSLGFSTGNFSTGGGATLAYLSGQSLPGLMVFM